MNNTSHIETSQELDIRPKFVIMASPEYQRIWENLTPTQQQLLENQASLRELDTEAKVNRFFESRTFDIMSPIKKVVSRKINESSQFIDDPLEKTMKQLWTL